MFFNWISLKTVLPTLIKRKHPSFQLTAERARKLVKYLNFRKVLRHEQKEQQEVNE